MHASRAAAALVFAGAALLAPTVAQADPWVDVSTNGTPIENGTTGTLGQPLLVEGTGCDNTSGTAVMGEFVASVGDPALLSAEDQRTAVAADQLFQIEMPVDETGNFSWGLEIPLENATGDFIARWYCASAPVTSLYDTTVTWVSPQATMTIEAAASRSARTTVGRAATASRTSQKAAASNAPAPTVSFGYSPDALPLVDRVAIPGPKSAALKARVDASLAKTAAAREKLARLVQRFDPKAAAALRKPVTNAEYVTAAHLELTNRLPSAKALKASTSRLDNEQLRVQVVEDIALTAHAANWWIAQK